MRRTDLDKHNKFYRKEIQAECRLDGHYRIHDTLTGVIIQGVFRKGESRDCIVYLPPKKTLRKMIMTSKWQLGGPEVQEQFWSSKTENCYEGGYTGLKRHGIGQLNYQQEENNITELGFWENGEKNSCFLVYPSECATQFRIDSYKNGKIQEERIVVLNDNVEKPQGSRCIAIYQFSMSKIGDIFSGLYNYIHGGGRLDMEKAKNFIQNGDLPPPSVEIQQNLAALERIWCPYYAQDSDISKVTEAGQMLLDSVVDSFLWKLKLEFWEKNEIFSLGMMNALQENKLESAFSYFQILEGYYHLFDRTYDKLFFPYARNQNHYVLWVMTMTGYDPFSISLGLYDSMDGSFLLDREATKIRNFFIGYLQKCSSIENKEDYIRAIRSSKAKLEKCAKQRDLVSCGVYLCGFVDKILRKESVQQLDVTMYRTKIAQVVKEVLRKIIKKESEPSHHLGDERDANQIKQKDNADQKSNQGQIQIQPQQNPGPNEVNPPNPSPQQNPQSKWATYVKVLGVVVIVGIAFGIYKQWSILRSFLKLILARKKYVFLI